jgi:hypothetical protein
MEHDLNEMGCSKKRTLLDIHTKNLEYPFGKLALPIGIIL